MPQTKHHLLSMIKIKNLSNVWLVTKKIHKILRKYKISSIINFAAETFNFKDRQISQIY